MDIEKKHIKENLTKELKKLISFDTSFPPGDTTDISNYIYQILNDCGYTVALYENEKGLVNIVAEMGKGPPSLVLNTHLDTVGPGKLENWNHNPFDPKVSTDNLSGLGAVNCKGSGAVQLWVAKQIAKKGGPLHGNVTFSFVADEENLGPNGTAFLRKLKAICPDILILGAPTNNSLIIEERGVLWVEIVTSGKSAHAGEPQFGDNAINRMVRICNHLEKEMSKRLGKREIRGMRSTINFGKIEGGINTNVVPNLCRTEIDRRLLPTEDYNNSFDEMLEIIENCTESKKYCTVRKLRGTNGFSGKKDSVIVKNISKSYREIVGRPIKFSNAIGVSDGRYFSDDDIEIVSFGPGIDKEGHSANESIDISTMTESALVLEKAIGYILGYNKY